MFHQKLALREAQAGATLIVGLVLLLALTIVGVSGMNMATMEITMAGNAQFQQDAFQMSEDAIDIALGTRDYAVDEDRVVDWIGGGAKLDRRAVTIYRGKTSVPDAAFSSGEVEAFHFDVVASGLGPRNARASQTQGFYVIGRAQ